MTAPSLHPEPGEMTVDVDPGTECCVVRVTGDVDTRSSPTLARHLRDAIDQLDVAVLEVDLREVTFLDSAGLTTLARAHRAATAAGRVLRLRCGTSRAVLRPLQITGLTTVLPVVDG